MDPTISSVSLVFTVAISLVSLFIAILALITQRIGHRRGAELYAYFEQDRKGFGDLLVLENVGDVALEMEVSVYVDPREDDRYPKNGSKPIWIFRRKLYPDRPKRWMHPFQAVLSQMGYRNDCVYIVRLVGKFWAASSGKGFSRDYFQKYQVSPIDGRWLYVEESDTDWYYADASPKVTLARDGIPEELRKGSMNSNGSVADSSIE